MNKRSVTVINASELKGRAVVSLDEAEKIGTLSSVVFDPAANRVVGFKVKTGVFGRTLGDVELDPEQYAITRYIMSGNLWNHLTHSEKAFAAVAGLRFGRDLLIVPDSIAGELAGEVPPADLAAPPALPPTPAPARPPTPAPEATPTAGTLPRRLKSPPDPFQYHLLSKGCAETMRVAQPLLRIQGISINKAGTLRPGFVYARVSESCAVVMGWWGRSPGWGRCQSRC